MRVISGIARGTHLACVDEDFVRPTLDRVKESLFNMIQTRILDATVLDLFAGSGALGIECLSRGAKQAVFCDKSPKCINIIKQNLKKTKFEEKACILNKDFKKCLEILAKDKKVFDILFVDPPYKLDLAGQAVESIIALGLLSEDGIIILETDEKQRDLKHMENLKVQVLQERKYGRVSLIFLNSKGA